LSLNRTSDLVLLLAETNTGDAAEELALRRSVEHALGLDDRQRPWYVERLFQAADSEPTPLDRYFRVSGSVDAPPNRFEQAAAELAYRLSEVTGYPVEADLPSSSFEPPASNLAEALTYGAGSEPAGSQPYTWALDAIRCREAWGLTPREGGTARGGGIIIAHPDTGYTDHPDSGVAALDLRRDWDLLENDDDARDPLDKRFANPLVHPGHGTSTGGVLAGRRVTCVEGVAPRATVVPLRTIKSVVQVFDSDVARAIEYARRIGAHVVSMSLGGTGFRGLRDAIDFAVADGLIVLAAAGNQVRRVVAPAIYANCIAVAATNAEDKPWRGSSRGVKVAISAPGESVWVPAYDFESSHEPQPCLERSSGTSFAVAHTAGTAALWLAHHGRDSLIETYGKHRLQAAFLRLLATHGHRSPPDWDGSNFGVGIIDAEALLSAPLPSPSDVDNSHERGLAATLTEPPGDRVAELFPELGGDEVEQRLVTLFGVPADTLPGKLDRYEPELVRVFGEHPEAWEAFAAPGADVAASVARFASPTLIRDLRTGQRSLA